MGFHIVEIEIERDEPVVTGNNGRSDRETLHSLTHASYIRQSTDHDHRVFFFAAWSRDCNFFFFF
jgi:hypothetical protein